MLPPSRQRSGNVVHLRGEQEQEQVSHLDYQPGFYSCCCESFQDLLVFPVVCLGEAVVLMRAMVMVKMLLMLTLIKVMPSVTCEISSSPP